MIHEYEDDPVDLDVQGLFRERAAAMGAADARRRLERAADLLDALGDRRWGKNLYAADATGAMVGVRDSAAWRWCVAGVTAREDGHPAARRLEEAYCRLGGAESLATVNDAAESCGSLAAHLRTLAHAGGA